MRHTQCVASRTFVKFTFIRVQPEWRRREPADRAQDKREFAAACRDFAEDHLLRAYSLVGTRGDCDLMAPHGGPVAGPDRRLPRPAEPERADALGGDQPLLPGDDQGVRLLRGVHALEPRPGSDAKYLIVYPMWKKREWYLLDPEERWRIMQGHIETGTQYTGIEINTA